MKSLKIASNLRLPVELVTQAVAVLAKRRAGKSYAMRRIAEQMFRAGQQIVMVDPKGDQWGIRSDHRGRGPGLAVVILGGEHGDIPLESGSGEVVAKLVVEQRISVVLDLSEFRKYEIAVFMTDFLETLYRLKAKDAYRTPVSLIIDEADAIAPQKPQKGEERMLGAAEDIVRRGGQRGIGCILVTQRSAVLNKNVLTQAQVLVALRTIAPQDLAAMDAWIQVHGEPKQRKELMESLPSLPTGDAWFWSPGWPTAAGIFKRVHVLPIDTYDSGATPGLYTKANSPVAPADVDIEAVKQQMEDAIKKAAADDPRELRRRIADLERQLAAAKKAQPAPEVKVKEVPVFDQEARRAVRAAVDTLEKLAGKMQTLDRDWDESIIKVIGNVTKLSGIVAHGQGKDRFSIAYPDDAPTAAEAYKGAFVRTADNKYAVKRSAELDGTATAKLGTGETRVLTAIAQHRDGCTREQITVLTGYKRSSRDTYLQRLRSAGTIDIVMGTGGNVFRATEKGVAMLGPGFRALPTGLELREHWMRELPAGERATLYALLDNYPAALTRERLSEITGYKRSSRDTYLQRLATRKLVVTDPRGLLKASDILF